MGPSLGDKLQYLAGIPGGVDDLKALERVVDLRIAEHRREAQALIREAIKPQWMVGSRLR